MEFYSCEATSQADMFACPFGDCRKGQIPSPSGANKQKRNQVMPRCSAAGYLTVRYLVKYYNVRDKDMLETEDNERKILIVYEKILYYS